MKIIVLRYKNRKLSSYLKFFLELFGFLTDTVADTVLDISYPLKERMDIDEIIDGSEYIFLNIGDDPQVSFELVRKLLKRQDFMVTEDDLQVMQEIWDDLYTEKLMQHIYTVSELYMNRKMRYKDTYLLENAVNGLDTLADMVFHNKWMKNCFGRIAYCALACQVNDALKKMEMRNWYEPEELVKICEDVLRQKPKLTGLYILKAEILRNQRHQKRKMTECYQWLYRHAESPAVKKYACFGLGERYQRAAEQMDLLLHVDALKKFKEYDEIDPYNIRVLFKIAMQEERRTFLDKSGDWSKAKNYYKRICDIVRKIGTERIGNIEFEYYYKALFRLGAIARFAGESDDAVKSFGKAGRSWDDLYESQYLSEIYKEDYGYVIEFLQNKYQRKDCVIWQQLAKIYEENGEMDIAREYYIRANTYEHKFGKQELN